MIDTKVLLGRMYRSAKANSNGSGDIVSGRSQEETALTRFCVQKLLGNAADPTPKGRESPFQLRVGWVSRARRAQFRGQLSP